MYAKLSIKAPSQPASIPTTKNKDAQYRDMPALDDDRGFSSCCRRNETHMCPCPFPSLCGISPRYFAHATVALLSMERTLLGTRCDHATWRGLANARSKLTGLPWKERHCLVPCLVCLPPPAAGPCRPFHVVSHLAYCVPGAIPTE